MTTSPKVSPLRFELVDVVKRLQADCDEVYREYYGRLSQHERQEELWTEFTDAWSGKDYQQAADSLAQFIEAAGHQMPPAEQDKLLKSIKAAEFLGDLGEPVVTAYQEYAAFEKEGPDEQLMELYWDHPLRHLYRMIEERTGVSQTDLAEFTDRLLSNQGIGPVSYARRPDGVLPEPLPDMFPVAEKLKELDRDGTTELLLHKLRELSPEFPEYVDLASDKITQPPAKRKRNSGRPVQRDHKQDKKIVEAWRTRQYPKYEDLALVLGIPTAEVAKAVDLARKPRKNNRPK